MNRTLWLTRRLLQLLLLAGVAYFLCLLFPEPFFRHSVRKDNIILYTASKPTQSADTLLEDVSKLLRRSVLDDPGAKHRVFLCNSLAEFGFFTRGRTDLGGLCDDHLTGNIFIRPASIEKGRVMAPPWWPYDTDPRPLSYFIAHEVTHSLESRYAGRWNLKVPVWLWEGYADYIGKGPEPMERYLDLLRQNAPVMDPKRGLYDRYQLYVMYLLDYKHQDIRALLDHPPSREALEDSVRLLSLANRP